MSTKKPQRPGAPGERRLPFFPAWLDDLGLDPFEFRVFARICRRSNGGRPTEQATGVCTESIARMAKGSGMSPATTKRTLSRLRERRMVDDASPKKRRNEGLRLRPTDPGGWLPQSQAEPGLALTDPTLAPTEPILALTDPTVGSVRATKGNKRRDTSKGSKEGGPGETMSAQFGAKQRGGSAPEAPGPDGPSFQAENVLRLSKERLGVLVPSPSEIADFRDYYGTASPEHILAKLARVGLNEDEAVECLSEKLRTTAAWARSASVPIPSSLGEEAEEMWRDVVAEALASGMSAAEILAQSHRFVEATREDCASVGIAA